MRRPPGWMLGLGLLLFGAWVIARDVHLAGEAHTVNAVLGGLIMFAGGYVLKPVTAADFATRVLALLERTVDRVAPLAGRGDRRSGDRGRRADDGR